MAPSGQSNPRGGPSPVHFASDRLKKSQGRMDLVVLIPISKAPIDGWPDPELSSDPNLDPVQIWLQWQKLSCKSRNFLVN
jgi:hypothetical protein